MTKDAILAEIMSWPPHQRAALAQQLWDSVAADDEPGPLTDAQRAELDRRVEHDLAHPDRGVTLDALRDRLRAKHGVQLHCDA